jgi:glucokinase
MDILAADIGGTNSRFAHFEATRNGELKLIKTQWLKTKEAPSFGSLIAHLKEDNFSLQPDKADIAVIAVAGPVERGVYSSPPFIGWDIDIVNAQSDFGFRRCLLINDFVAQAFACRSPIAKSAKQILSGHIVPDATVAVIGAGTGLGKAALVPDVEGGLVAVPSEGGHANFAFVSKKECDYQDFLIRELGDVYITGNTVVSGRGISLLHLFLTGEKLDTKEVISRLLRESETLKWAARFYARVCRNYALETLSLGGLYIAGGVAARTPDLLTHEAFATEFRSSPTMSKILEQIPVFLISNEESGLWGAAVLGLQTLKKK